jgi:hypothetical protein
MPPRHHHPGLGLVVDRHHCGGFNVVT